jgi:hypothetical protein
MELPVTMSSQAYGKVLSQTTMTDFTRYIVEGIKIDYI